MPVFKPLAMATSPQDGHKYFLSDNKHYFIIRDDEYDASFKRVLFYNGPIYIANERLLDRTVEVLTAEFERRRIPTR